MWDYERSVRPKEVTTDSLIICGRLRSLRDIATQIGISFGVVPSVLTDILGMSKVSARWVPRMLTKIRRRAGLIFLSIPSLSLYEDDPEEFMRRVVTQEEAWVHHIDPEAKKT